MTPVTPAAPTTTAAAVPRGHSGPMDLEGYLLSVVADRTGYPAEILNLDMALEADLGIDSIKRVEILSAVRDRVGEPAERASCRR